MKTLWVCWKEPEKADGDAVLLSFLCPSKEEKVKREFKGKFISARQIAPGVKDHARALYVRLIANIGCAAARNGKTLRECLKNKEGVSLWWFHKVSEKDCESDNAFNVIIEALVIASVAETEKCDDIVLYGGVQELRDVLKESYSVRTVQCRRANSGRQLIITSFIMPLLSRMKYFFTFLRRWRAVKKTTKAPPASATFDVVFEGFWDWSVKEESGKLYDMYFKSLPEKLSFAGLRCGWFAWFDPYYGPGARGRLLEDVLVPLRRYENVILLQHFVSPLDLLKALLNFNPFLTFVTGFSFRANREVFMEEGLDFMGLLGASLIQECLNSTLPHMELVYSASRRAFERYKPKVSVSFLEFYLHSRAFYAAGKNGCPDAVHGVIQHASYSREKTFGALDKEREFEGKPDGCAMPHADIFFAMGALGREIFAESGYPDDKMFLTGSSRYEHIKTNDVVHEEKEGAVKKILMVTSLDRDLEMEMVEAACLAAEPIPQVQLFLRSHPFAPMHEHPDFYIYSDRVQLTRGTLEEDLKNADLIFFTTSTVAEEALLKGIPVWQWLTASYNGSVFRDVKVIPSFCSVCDLGEGLKKFIEEPRRFLPGKEIIEKVREYCFYSTDGKASDRIADILREKFLPRPAEVSRKP